jgi:hypothetical protein
MLLNDIFWKTKVIVQFQWKCILNACTSSIICINPLKPPELTFRSLYIFVYIVYLYVPYDFHSIPHGIYWLVFLMEAQCFLCEVRTAHTHTHTHIHVGYMYYGLVSVFKQLRDERQNYSKSRGLSSQVILRLILTIRFLCPELYTQQSQLFSPLVISQTVRQG